MPILSICRGKQPRTSVTRPKPRAQKNSKNADSLSSKVPMDYELDDLSRHMDMAQQRPKRLKRLTKSINENIEPAFMATPNPTPGQV